MNPCPERREAMLLCAANGLDPAAAGELDRHLQTCPGCRRFHRQARSLSAELEGTFHRVDEPAPSVGFHARVVRAITNPAPAGSAFLLARWWRHPLSWAAAGAVITLLCWVSAVSSRDHRRSASIPAPVVRVLPAPEHLLPRRQAYVQALNRSWEEFDTLTRRDDNRLAADRPPGADARWQ